MISGGVGGNGDVHLGMRGRFSFFEDGFVLADKLGAKSVV